MSPRVHDRLRVEPGSKVDLTDHPTDQRFGWEKVSAREELAAVKVRLDDLQHRLHAEATRSVLVVLQAMDAAGKDGTIRSILSGLNPAGVSVANFKAPGGREARQDYLWRVHHVCPERGQIGVFNRSHYEDVLVVRVKELAPEAVWKRRYAHINHFERMLSDEGTRIVKVFLHVSHDVQKQRLQDRLDNPAKNWKFRAGDLEDRALWPDFQRAYADAISKTSTASAPWYVVPADRNWVRNLAVAQILLHALEDMDPRFPAADPAIEQITIT